MKLHFRYSNVFLWHFTIYRILHSMIIVNHLSHHIHNTNTITSNAGINLVLFWKLLPFFRSVLSFSCYCCRYFRRPDRHRCCYWWYHYRSFPMIWVSSAVDRSRVWMPHIICISEMIWIWLLRHTFICIPQLISFYRFFVRLFPFLVIVTVIFVVLIVVVFVTGDTIIARFRWFG